MCANTLNNLTKSSPVGIFYTDEFGDCSYVNECWCKITGLNPEQANFVSWLAAIHPEDRERVRQEWQTAFNNCRSYFSAHRYLHQDGAVTWCKAQAFPERKLTTQTTNYIGTLIDVTTVKQFEQNLEQSAPELKEYIKKSTQDLDDVQLELIKDKTKQLHLVELLTNPEENFRALVKSISDFVLLIDRDGNILFINRTLRGLNKQTVLGSNLYNYIPDEQQRQTAKNATALAFDLGKIQQYQCHALGHDGNLACYSVSCGPMKLEGKTVSTLLIFTDITDCIDLEKKIKQHREQLNHVYQSCVMDEMMSNLANELNQPLGAISNYTKGCMRRLKNDQYHQEQLLQVMQNITDQVERAGNIMSRIRNLTKKAPENKQLTSINKTINSAINFIGSHTNNNLKIVRNFSKKLPEIFVDPLQIEQVVSNIIRNSIEAMRQNRNRTAVLTITTSLVKNNRILVSITDTGPGIPENILDKVFTPFFSTKKKSTGLGLSVCRSIIESHNGYISITNEPNGGAALAFSLPITLDGR